MERFSKEEVLILKEYFVDFFTNIADVYFNFSDGNKHIEWVKMDEKLDEEVYFDSSRKRILLSFIINKKRYYLEISEVDNYGVKKNFLSELLITFRKFYGRILSIGSTNESFENIADDIILQTIIASLMPTSDKESRNNVSKLIDSLTLWTSKTYEGSKTDFAICVVKSKIDCGIEDNIKKFFDSKYSATFCSDFSNAAILDTYGNLVNYVGISANSEKILVENNNKFIGPDFPRKICASIFEKYDRDEICLSVFVTKHGDILLYDNDFNIYAIKRFGRWQIVMQEIFAQNLFFYTKKLDGICNIKKQDHNPNISNIFNFLLDISFDYSGGILAFIENFDEFVKGENIDKSMLCNKISSGGSELNSLNIIKYKFLSYKNSSIADIPHSSLLELTRMDGATIVKQDDLSLVTCGFIMQNVEPCSYGGGRTAAACSLSKYGYSFKISEDGKITLFVDKKLCFTIN